VCVVRSQGDPHFQVDRSEDTRQQRQRRLTCTGLNPGDGRLGDPANIGKLALRHASLKARQSQHVAGEAVDGRAFGRTHPCHHSMMANTGIRLFDGWPRTPRLLGGAEHFGDRPLHPAGLNLLRRDLELPPRRATEISSRAGTSPVYRNHDEKGAASAL